MPRFRHTNQIKNSKKKNKTKKTKQNKPKQNNNNAQPYIYLSTAIAIAFLNIWIVHCPAVCIDAGVTLIVLLDFLA